MRAARTGRTTWGEMGRVRARSRARARGAALDLMAFQGRMRGTTTAGLSVPRVHFVYLHDVPEHELERFDRLVGRLAEHHELVSYSEAVRRLSAPALEYPSLTFSFDDGFASNVGAGRVLGRRGVSACFFLPTGFIGCRQVSEARRFFRTAEGVDEPAMTWGDVERLVAGGHEVGNHTVNHMTLAHLSLSQVEDEIEGARAELLRRLGVADHFAWPRGRFEHTSAEAVRAVYQTGHWTCASAERGSHEPGRSVARPCIRRDHLMTSWPLRHAAYFVARSAWRRGDGSWPTGWDIR